jgi:nitrous oxide reductase accessory protein NosL
MKLVTFVLLFVHVVAASCILAEQQDQPAQAITQRACHFHSSNMAEAWGGKKVSVDEDGRVYLCVDRSVLPGNRRGVSRGYLIYSREGATMANCSSSA